MFENRVLRKVFGPKRDEVTGEWRKLHNEELSDLYCLPYTAFEYFQEEGNFILSYMPRSAQCSTQPLIRQMPDVLFLGESSVNAVDSGKIVRTLWSVFSLPVQNIFCEDRGSYSLRNVGMCIPQQKVSCATRCYTLIGEPLACVVECIPASARCLLLAYQVEAGL